MVILPLEDCHWYQWTCKGKESLIQSTYKSVTSALENYKNFFATACKNGWAKKDLLRAGFADPAKLRLPREKKTAANDAEAN